MLAYFSLLRFVEAKTKKVIALSMIVVLCTICCNLFAPVYFIRIIENYSSSPQNIIKIALIYALIWGYAQVGEQLREMIAIKPIEKFIKNLSLNIVNTVLYERSPFVDGSKYLNAMVKAQFSIGSFLSALLFFILPIMIESFSVLWIVYYLYSLQITLLFFGILLLFVLISYFASKHFLQQQLYLSEKTELFLSQFSDRLKNLPIIKVNAQEESELTEFSWNLEYLYTLRTAKSIYFERSRLLQGLIMGLSMLGCMYYMTTKMQEHALRLEDLVLIHAYFIQLAVPLSMLSSVFKDLSEGLADILYLQNFLSNKKPVLSKKITLKKTDFDADIFVRNVSFSYSHDAKILNKISFRIPSQKLTIIVGENGVGKSTIASLLSNLYVPNGGGIFIGANNLQNISRKSYADHIAFVEQNPMVFENTIHENLRYGTKLKNAPLGLMQNIVRKLPLQEHTLLQKGESYLSGGELKFLILQRAFNKNPSLMILDEPTEHLDTERKEILYKILQSSHDVTRVTITHDDTLLKEGDHLVVLGKTGVIYEGTPDRYIKPGVST